MAAEQRHHRAAVLRDGNHRRLALLVGDDRCQSADQGARRAETYDGPAVEKGRLQLRREVVEEVIHGGKGSGCIDLSLLLRLTVDDGLIFCWRMLWLFGMRVLELVKGLGDVAGH